ncbi:hypothetical protein GQ607_002936 [Colletotrichum asianum]|uniref:Uncharacterized protein n=1 Tax=Colletotrichum asianum TaxID=702518 RepID=A0A8H3WSC5_9PEZI|nr:hypothetical protein GQ607_002936 [Colletotrichum asianum]
MCTAEQKAQTAATSAFSLLTHQRHYHRQRKSTISICRRHHISSTFRIGLFRASCSMRNADFALFANQGLLRALSDVDSIPNVTVFSSRPRTPAATTLHLPAACLGSNFSHTHYCCASHTSHFENQPRTKSHSPPFTGPVPSLGPLTGEANPTSHVRPPAPRPALLNATTLTRHTSSHSPPTQCVHVYTKTIAKDPFREA